MSVMLLIASTYIHISKPQCFVIKSRPGSLKMIEKLQMVLSTPTLPLEILDEVPLNSSSFIPPLLTVEFINQLNTSQILLVTMPQFFGTLSPSK